LSLSDNIINVGRKIHNKKCEPAISAACSTVYKEYGRIHKGKRLLKKNSRGCGKVYNKISFRS
jgi:hypothetical protein